MNLAHFKPNIKKILLTLALWLISPIFLLAKPMGFLPFLSVWIIYLVLHGDFFQKHPTDYFILLFYLTQLLISLIIIYIFVSKNEDKKLLSWRMLGRFFIIILFIGIVELIFGILYIFIK